MKMKPMDFWPRRSRAKTCGECTACCEGWLRADLEIRGQKYAVRPDKPCPFIENYSCKIHNTGDQPDSCKKYTCMWLDDPKIPDWMRPDKSGVILTEKSHGGQSYIQMVETGKKVDSTVLARVIQYSFLHGKNLEFTVAGDTYHLGSPEFMRLALEKIPTSSDKYLGK